MSERLLYELDLLGRRLQAKSVTGREGISSPFRFVIRYVDEGLRGPHRELLRASARLRITRGGRLREIAGITTAVRVGANPLGAPEIEVTLEPGLVLLRYVRDARIFRDRTAVQIVEELLSEVGIHPEKRLSGSYPVRAYCVQWRESSLDFVHRLLEDEGIFYFFDEEGRMVLADHTAAYGPEGREIPFRPESGLEPGLDCISELDEEAELGPSPVRLRDFNPEKPRLDMEVEARAAIPSDVTWYDYPGEYEVPEEGKRRAGLMADAFESGCARVRGRAIGAHLAPGRLVHVLDAPGGQLDLVILGMSHGWNIDKPEDPGGFEALEASTLFRPPRITPVPVMTNPLTGFVTGAAGRDIHTDEWGRVKVHFHWDRRQPKDDRCSDWIPVLQDNTGSSLATGRVGWEVLVNFLEGDPDRPVVVGRVYNAGDTFPVQLPYFKTQFQLRSLSSPTRDGENRVQFEDSAGDELMMMHAERDTRVAVSQDKQKLSLRHVARIVQRDETVTVGNEQSLAVKAQLLETVGGNQSVTIGGSRSAEVADDKHDVAGHLTTTIGGMHLRLVGTHDVASGSTLDEEIGGVAVDLARTATEVSAMRLSTIKVGGALVEIAGDSKNVTAGEARAETVGGFSMTKAKTARIDVEGQRSTRVGLKLSAESEKAMTFMAGEELSFDASKLSLGAEALRLKVGDSTITVQNGVCSVYATTIRIEADGASALLAAYSTQG